MIPLFGASKELLRHSMRFEEGVCDVSAILIRLHFSHTLFALIVEGDFAAVAHLLNLIKMFQQLETKYKCREQC